MFEKLFLKNIFCVHFVFLFSSCSVSVAHSSSTENTVNNLQSKYGKFPFGCVCYIHGLVSFILFYNNKFFVVVVCHVQLSLFLYVLLLLLLSSCFWTLTRKIEYNNFCYCCMIRCTEATTFRACVEKGKDSYKFLQPNLDYVHTNKIRVELPNFLNRLMHIFSLPFV